MLDGREGRLFSSSLPASLSVPVRPHSAAAESLECSQVLVALGTVVSHVVTEVEIAGQQRTEAAAQTTEQTGGEPGKHAQLRLRLGEDEEAAVRALSVQRSRAQPFLGHLHGEGNVVEDGDHPGGVHHSHLPLQVATVKRGDQVVWKSLPLFLLL